MGRGSWGGRVKCCWRGLEGLLGNDTVMRMDVLKEMMRYDTRGCDFFCEGISFAKGCHRNRGLESSGSVSILLSVDPSLIPYAPIFYPCVFHSCLHKANTPAISDS